MFFFFNLFDFLVFKAKDCTLITFLDCFHFFSVIQNTKDRFFANQSRPFSIKPDNMAQTHLGACEQSAIYTKLSNLKQCALHLNFIKIEMNQFHFAFRNIGIDLPLQIPE